LPLLAELSDDRTRRSEMGKYVLAYRGGVVAETKAEQQAQMEKWMNWFGGLGSSVVDGGGPFGPSSTISSSGSAADSGAAGLTGYSILEADDLAEAVGKAKGCPVLDAGGSVEVYESMPIG
jgi:hypothetical protein